MGPIKVFRELLARHCLLADIDEFFTSQKCAAMARHHFCDHQLKKAEVKDEQGLPWRPHQVKQCTNCFTVSLSLPVHFVINTYAVLNFSNRMS